MIIVVPGDSPGHTDIKPVVADGTVQSELLAVDAGYVSGIVQDGTG